MIDSKSKKENAPTKAGVAREFMKKIGAFTKNPPEGWADKVEAHLKEKGFNIPASNKVQIYTIRSEAMKKELKTNKKAKNTQPTSKSKRKVSGSVHEFTLEDLSAAKKYAADNGGIVRCMEVMKALHTLSK